MKMKSFAMLAAGLLTTSLAFVTPAMADDTTNSGSATQAPSDNMGSTQDSTQTSPTPGDSTTTTPSTGNVGSTDEGTPDTATGDDDY